MSALEEQWDKILKRIVSKGREQRGLAVVTIQVVIDATGSPVFWFELEMKRIEPCTSGARFMAELISGMRMTD